MTKSVLPFSKTLLAAANVQEEAQTQDKRLDQAEVALGDHVTGGVVQSWRQLQRTLGDFLSEVNHTGCITFNWPYFLCL